MDKDLEEKIRKRAYEIWERKGYSGVPEDHWLEAERELAGAASASTPADAEPEARADAINQPDPAGGDAASPTKRRT